MSGGRAGVNGGCGTLPAMRIRSLRAARALGTALLVLLLSAAAGAQEPVVYRVSFPAPEHHYAEIEVTFRDVPAGALEARMSRSSPGRYAIHEFAKNVFELHAFDGKGAELTPVRPNPYQWDVAGHDGTVRIVYKIFGRTVDGTYLAIDESHAHMNIPATFMWARGFDARPVRVTFVPPEGRNWTPATQLFPTDDPWTFTAPNFQYFMDSPVELADQVFREFQVSNPDGKTFTIRIAMHYVGTEAALEEYVAATKKIVEEQAAVFGEYPEFDTGTYTFLADYVPWGGGDGMEHRNSTVVAAPIALRTSTDVARVLGTVSHEFFHAWNVERIRPKSLEPFDFEEANMADELWLAEGFTSYYDTLTMHRAGLVPFDRALASFGGIIGTALNGPGRRFRSVVEMSRWAPFADAARSVDETNRAITFVSYYTWGAAIGLALDVELRARSNGTVTLDDYMRRMWVVHGKPGGAPVGYVANPYTMQDARDRLAEVSDRAFADEFFSRYIEGREAPDYATLLAPAGLMLRPRSPGTSWIGAPIDANGRVTQLVAWGTPAFEAGLEQDAVIRTIDGRPVSRIGDVLRSRKPGDSVAITFTRRSGEQATGTLVLGEDPSVELVPAERDGTLTAGQRAFRDAWLGSRVNR
jgi:predicted metalloprotease with PDZ domain